MKEEEEIFVVYAAGQAFYGKTMAEAEEKRRKYTEGR